MATSNHIKAISIDLDGTLFKSDGTVAASTIDTLNKCKTNGIELIFNTARPMKMIPGFIHELFPDNFWVLSNGTTCLKNENKVFHETMTNSQVVDIIRHLHTHHPEYFFSIESEGKIYTTSTNEERNMKYYAETISFDSMLVQNINKIIIIAENRDFPIEALSPLLHASLKLLVTEQGKYVQIMPRAISKLSAVLNILSSLNLNLSNLLSFGDDLNDMELILASEIGVAMGNADKAIKHCADYVTTSNDRNGVGEFIDQLFSF